MSNPVEPGAKLRGAVAIGWLLLLPIALGWAKYRQGIASASYSDSPLKSGFTFFPVAFFFGLSFAMYLLVRREAPERPGMTLFFWIAATPIVAEFLVAAISR